MHYPTVTSLAVSLASLALFAGHASAQSYKYDFGSSSKVEAGFTKVGPGVKYSSAQGYGFENGASISAVDRATSDALRSDYVTSGGEFLFSVKVPQGNYNVTFYLGDPTGTSETSVHAENRRFLFDRVTTPSGQTATRTITVNRREVKSVDGTVTMSIKDRELDYYTWDEKLTLRFFGPKTAVAGVELTKVNDAITVFLCGNSTVVDQLDAANEGWCSWGQAITQHFKPGVSIANYAESGLTSGGFLSMKRLDKIVADAKAGDYVFWEFGHNDQKDDTDVRNYPTNMKTFRDKVLAKNAIPILVSPTARDGDRDPNTSIAGLAKVMRDNAKTLNVTLIDLNDKSITLMKTLGSNEGLAYMDASHFTRYGAFELGRIVATELKKLNNSLTPFLNPELLNFDPTKPDPVNYLTTPGTPTTGLAGRLGADKGMEGSVHAGLVHGSIEYRVPAPGPVEFVIHHTDGKKALSKSARLQQTQGTLAWPEMNSLPKGMYMLSMKAGHQAAKALFCRL